MSLHGLLAEAALIKRSNISLIISASRGLHSNFRAYYRGWSTAAPVFSPSQSITLVSQMLNCYLKAI